jgi:hypothetical protein
VHLSWFVTYFSLGVMLAGLCLLGYACWVMLAGLCLLGYACLVMLAWLCLLGYAYWVMLVLYRIQSGQGLSIYNKMRGALQ